MSDVFLHRLETFVPPFTATQDVVASRLAEWSSNPVTTRMIRHVFQRTGIHRRHSVIPDFTGPGAPELFKRTESGSLQQPSTRERMQVFCRHAGPIAVQLARQLLDRDSLFQPADVTHVITVSCTGFQNPGPDLSIVSELGLCPGVERYHLGFMGCYAAMPALRMARQFCLARPEAVVLVVAYELCSLHMQSDSSPDTLLGNALFSDGAAAALISARPPEDHGSALRLLGFGSDLAPDSSRAMAWEVGNFGFHLMLSSYVPDVIAANVEAIVERLIHLHGLGLHDIDLWAVHPGGKTILDRVADALVLDPHQIADSRQVLHDYGNMSSATVLFVLKRMLESQDAMHHQPSIVAMAFGPGLTIESAVLEKVPAKRPLAKVTLDSCLAAP
jgi:predicted naringenin-chalcone synthase